MTERGSAPPSDYRPGGAPFTGRRMLAAVCGLFGVMLAANGALTFFAVSGFRGVVVDSGFDASQTFNADAAAAEAVAARGWSAEAEAEGGRPVLRLTDADGAPLAGLSLTATALRPLDARGDRRLSLAETEPGVWTAAEALPPGQWRIAFSASASAAEPWRASRLIVVEER